jgi:hypothetical protein
MHMGTHETDIEVNEMKMLEILNILSSRKDDSELLGAFLNGVMIGIQTKQPEHPEEENNETA